MNNFELWFNDLTSALGVLAALFIVVAIIAAIKKLTLVFWCEFVGAVLLILSFLHRTGIYTFNPIPSDSLIVPVIGMVIGFIPMFIFIAKIEREADMEEWRRQRAVKREAALEREKETPAYRGNFDNDFNVKID